MTGARPLLDAASVRSLLRAAGLRARHDRSQNFLVDVEVLESILEAAEPRTGGRVLEIGPGLNATVSLPAPGAGLEFPQYTRPREWEGHAVPDVLFSGHHAKIAAWRQQQSELRTATVRPDLVRSPRSTGG